ncbi:MAG: HAD family phosphatase [Dehalococcoidia bacterium]|nr:HAD family phosphatase [Dehalococcoidia bacterium]
MSARAILWDMDGVIVDSAPFHFQAWQELLGELGLAFTRTDFEQTFGRRNAEIIAEKVPAKLPSSEVRRLSNRKEERFRDLIARNIEAFPGVLSLMRSAKAASWKMALVTSTPPENIDVVLRELGIAGFFEAIVAERDVRRGKPDPEGFLLAASMLKVPPGRCIVIKDAVAGVKAARAAGMKCIAVTNTHPTERLVEADLIVDSLDRLTEKTVADLLEQPAIS